MYKLIRSQTSGEVAFAQNTESGMFIPFVDDNTDFQEYQRWLAEGHTPEPAETQE